MYPHNARIYHALVVGAEMGVCDGPITSRTLNRFEGFHCCFVIAIRVSLYLITVHKRWRGSIIDVQSEILRHISIEYGVGHAPFEHGLTLTTGIVEGRVCGPRWLRSRRVGSGMIISLTCAKLSRVRIKAVPGNWKARVKE